MYPHYIWLAINRNENIPRFKRFLLFVCLLVFPCTFFAIFAYGFPLLLLSDGMYCPGDTLTDDRYCQSAKDAGAAPFILMFCPTLLMWVFDTIAFTQLGVLKCGGDPDNETCSRKCSRMREFMLPRFGLTLLYCGLICLSGSKMVQQKIQQEPPQDVEAKLDFVERQRRAGIISMACASILFCIPVAHNVYSACIARRKRMNGSERDER